MALFEGIGWAREGTDARVRTVGRCLPSMMALAAVNLTSCADDLPSLAKRDAGAEPAASATPPPRFVAVGTSGGAGAGGSGGLFGGGGAAGIAERPVQPDPKPPGDNQPEDLEPRRDWTLSLLHGVADVASVRFCILSSLAGDQPGSWLTTEPVPAGGLAYGEAVIIGAEEGDARRLQEGAVRVYVVAGEAEGGSVPACAALLPDIQAFEWQLRFQRGGRALRWDELLRRGATQEGGSDSPGGGARDASVADASVADASVAEASVAEASVADEPGNAVDAAQQSVAPTEPLDAGAPQESINTLPALPDGGLAPESLAAAFHLQSDGGASLDTAQILSLVEFAPGSLKEELSRLLVVSGCFGVHGPTSSTDLLQGRLVCGPDYGRRPTTLTPVFVRLTRTIRLGKVALQAVNAVPAAARMTLRSDPQESDGLLLTLGQEQRFGTVQPQVGFTSASVVQLGPMNQSTLDLTLGFGEEPRLSQVWADALWVSGLAALEDSKAYTLVSIGPQPGLESDGWFNPTFITLVDNDPLGD